MTARLFDVWLRIGAQIAALSVIVGLGVLPLLAHLGLTTVLLTQLAVSLGFTATIFWLIFGLPVVFLVANSIGTAELRRR